MSIAYSPDGHYIACGGIDGIVCIFDLATGNFPLLQVYVYFVRFTVCAVTLTKRKANVRGK